MLFLLFVCFLPIGPNSCILHYDHNPILLLLCCLNYYASIYSYFLHCKCAAISSSENNVSLNGPAFQIFWSGDTLMCTISCMLALSLSHTQCICICFCVFFFINANTSSPFISQFKEGQ